MARIWVGIIGFHIVHQKFFYLDCMKILRTGHVVRPPIRWLEHVECNTDLIIVIHFVPDGVCLNSPATEVSIIIIQTESILRFLSLKKLSTVSCFLLNPLALLGLTSPSPSIIWCSLVNGMLFCIPFVPFELLFLKSGLPLNFFSLLMPFVSLLVKFFLPGNFAM